MFLSPLIHRHSPERKTPQKPKHCQKTGTRIPLLLSVIFQFSFLKDKKKKLITVGRRSSDLLLRTTFAPPKMDDMSFTSVLPRLLSVSGRLKAKKRTAITRISSYSTDLTSINRAWSNQKRNNRRKFSARPRTVVHFRHRSSFPSSLSPSFPPSLPQSLQSLENLSRIFFLPRLRSPNVHIRLSSATEIEKMSLLHCYKAGWPRANGGSGGPGDPSSFSISPFTRLLIGRLPW